jgi:hypothetical protein
MDRLNHPFVRACIQSQVKEKIYEEGAASVIHFKKITKFTVEFHRWKIENGITPTMGMFMAPLEYGVYFSFLCFPVKNEPNHVKFLYNFCEIRL